MCRILVGCQLRGPILALVSTSWKQLCLIVASWAATLPFAGLLAAVILLVFRPTVCQSCPWN